MTAIFRVIDCSTGARAVTRLGMSRRLTMEFFISDSMHDGVLCQGRRHWRAGPGCVTFLR